MLWKVHGIVIPLLLLSLMIVVGHIPRISSQLVGVLCISNNSSSPSPGCPSSPLTFTGVVGQRFAVTLNIQGSDSFNGYNITVNTDPSVLKPVSVDLTGGLISPPPPCQICPPPITIKGGTVNIAVLGFSLTTAPTTGRLFNISYIVAGSGSTPVGFPASCPGSSDGSFCVLLTNGSKVPVPETLLPGTFNTPGSTTLVLGSSRRTLL